MAKFDKLKLYHFETEIFLERNRQVIEILENSNLTLEDVGKKFDLTRERVRQIYTRENFLGLREKRAKERFEKRKKKLSRVRFECKVCKKSVTLEIQKGGYKYCKDCRIKGSSVDFRIKLRCKHCGKIFNPNRARGDAQTYCSLRCSMLNKQLYLQRIKKNCIICGSEINATFNQRYCLNCPRPSGRENRKDYMKRYYFLNRESKWKQNGRWKI